MTLEEMLAKITEGVTDPELLDYIPQIITGLNSQTGKTEEEVNALIGSAVEENNKLWSEKYRKTFFEGEENKPNEENKPKELFTEL